MQYVFVYVPNFHPNVCFIPAATRLVIIVHTTDSLVLPITRSQGSVTSVVRATHQVNVRRQNYPSHHTHTP